MRTPVESTALVVHKEEDTDRVLASGPEVHRGFRENATVELSVTDPRAVQLLVDDEPLERAGRAGSWAWRPGFHAGEVEVEALDATGARLVGWRIDVSPDPRKVGSEFFKAMVLDLMDFDPTLVLGREPARERMGSLGEGEDPLVALMRLRQHEASIRRAFHAVTQEPLRATRRRRTIVPPHVVRRADQQTARAALRHPGLLAALEVVECIQSESGLGAALWADAPDTSVHLDHAATRCLLVLLQALRRRCRAVQGRLGKLVAAERGSAATITPLGTRWPRWFAWLDEFRRHLARVARGRPFDAVERAEVSAAGLNALSAHPLYAAAWRSGWRALKTGVQGDERPESLPISPTWEIYERWCFLEVLRGLRRRHASWTWRELPASRGIGSDRTWEGTGEDRRIRLHLQQTFPCTGGDRREGPWSLSRERRPDLVLEVTQGDSEACLILDAKYRASRSSLLEAMGAAHTYQDSLRWGSRRPVASLLLVPAATEVQWLAEREFIDEYRVGILPLSPQGERGDLVAELCHSLIASHG